MFQKHGLQAAIEVAVSCDFNSIDQWSTPGRAQHMDVRLRGEHFADIRQQFVMRESE